MVVISANQLKQTNLIFAEHKYLKLANESLIDKVNIQDSIIANYKQIDSIQQSNITQLSIDNLKLQKTLSDKHKLTKNPGFWIGVSGMIIGVILSILR